MRIAPILFAVALLLLSGAVQAQEFSDLSAEQRALLAPLEAHWDGIEPQRRERLAGMAARVANGTEQEKERFQRGLDRFVSLDDRERQQVRRLFNRFRNLPPGERQEIIQRVMAMPESERHAFAFGMRIADRTRDAAETDWPAHARVGNAVEAWLKSLPADERRRLVAELRELTPPERLRRIADAMDARGPVTDQAPRSDGP